MIHRALLVAALILLDGAASAAPNHFQAPAAPAVSVRAGLGGSARPGRWMPVDVTIHAGDAPLTGTLSVEWGSAVSRRDLDLAASSSERVTMHIRTIAASPGVHVTVTRNGGETAASLDVPLTLIPAETEESIRVCIGDTDASVPCSVSIPESEAPSSARAFDMADEVAWTNPSASSSRESAQALALWRASRWWQDSGSVDPIVSPFDRVSRLADRTRLSLALFVAALMIGTAIAAWRRAPALLLAGLPVVVTAGGVALVTKSSRDVDMQAASFVHQFAGVSQSMVRMKGEVEHPSGDTVSITPEMKDISVEVLYGLQNSESITTTDGQPVYRRTAGRAVRSRFELHGALDREWLAVTPASEGLLIENRSPFVMSDCELRSQDVIDIGVIAVGASAKVARSAGLSPGDAVVCAIPAEWLRWSAPAATSIRTRGSAFLIFHAWPGPQATPSEPHASR
jgi:hypothetical protein